MKKRWRRTGRVLVALLLAVCSLSVNLSPVLAVTQADIDALKDDAGDLSARTCWISRLPIPLHRSAMWRRRFPNMPR